MVGRNRPGGDSGLILPVRHSSLVLSEALAVAARRFAGAIVYRQRLEESDMGARRVAAETPDSTLEYEVATPALWLMTRAFRRVVNRHLVATVFTQEVVATPHRRHLPA